MLRRLAIAVLVFAAITASAHAQLDRPPDTVTRNILTISVNNNNDLTNWAWEGKSWSDPGATCSYGTTSWTVHADTGLDTSTVGSQTLTYTCTLDGSTRTADRTVDVYADEPPSISLTHTSYTVHNQEANSSYLGATCTDAVDGNLPVSVSQNEISRSESDTESSTTIEYTFACVDHSKQLSTATGTVTQIFKVNKPPTITLAYTERTVYNENAQSVHLGATCTDAIDGDIAVSFTQKEISRSGSGDDITVVVEFTFSCTDSDNNTVTATGTVTEDWGPNLGRA